jgi:hypothetical protein
MSTMSTDPEPWEEVTMSAELERVGSEPAHRASRPRCALDRLTSCRR